MTDSFKLINNETIFSNSSHSLSESEDDLVSDKVNILANSIYEEFENLIKLHGQGTVDGLMPLIVTMLETMDKLYTCKDELSLQVDLLKEDQAQLYTQYEREKLSRKLADEKINRIEDQFEEERQLCENRVESLESNLKLGDMKLRNCRDLISRHEEKEVEMRKEFNILQQRYADLLRTKADQKHRHLNSQCTTEDVSSGCQSPQLSSKQKPDKAIMNVIYPTNHTQEQLNLDETDSTLGDLLRDRIRNMNSLSLKDEMINVWDTDNLLTPVHHSQPIIDTNVMLEFDINEENFGSSNLANNDFHTDEEDVGLENDFDDLGMSKEIEFLLKENQDLIETKNALNIVKDDLITKLDELTGELCLLREDLRNSNLLKKQYKFQYQDLEKRQNETLQQLKEKDAKLLELGEDENLIECAVDQNGVQTKTKFTRAEVARILLERNKYKEELLELQETVRYQMSIMSQKNERPKKGSMWNFFSSVLSNATAFTAEAIVGSGNEMTVTQLSRNFNSHSNDTVILNGDGGAFYTIPNLSNQSAASRKRATPGSVMRVSNPLFNPMHDNNAAMIDLVPLDEIEKKTTSRETINDSAL